jgi:serine carboxypeptidase-like clade 2
MLTLICVGNAYLEYYFTHGLISIETYKHVQATCQDNVGQYAGLYVNKPCLRNPNLTCSNACESAVRDAFVEADTETDLINPYFIYGDVCMLPNHQVGALQYRTNIQSSMHRGPYAPCTDTFTEQYLRLPAVQDAIHVYLGSGSQRCETWFDYVFYTLTLCVSISSKIGS